ncbi:hypothetical protein J6397_28820 [Rhodococcus qingshengii]|uniref:hypothetical protein n=1 Tax=Rhodococcus qingshengii TaxID=334542 RepID=UPI001AE77B2B|nr:hypothetical protein [Rhodococcus qingshengii]MBP1054166.1 hypothetical protein [Rhodococcus qingshengii]
MSTKALLEAKIENLVSHMGPVAARAALWAAMDRRTALMDQLASDPDRSPPSAKVLKARAQLWPTISRNRSEHVSATGRVYGATTDPAQQRQADAGSWRAGQEVRDQELPLTVAEDGVVVRVWAVLAWVSDGAGKWVAVLDREMPNDELWQLQAPFLIGDELPILGQTAYWPVAVDLDGRVYRGGEMIKKWDDAANSFRDVRSTDPFRLT